MKQIAVMVVGWLLVAIGVAGLVLPVIPGWALIFVGGVMLGFDAARCRRLLDRIESRFPAFGRLTSRVRTALTRHADKPTA